MSGSQQLLLGGAPTVTPVDPYFYSVTSLLHGDGTNGGQNNTFLDSSANAFSITRNGNTTQGSFSPFSQTGWSNYFDGSGDYLSGPTNNAVSTFAGDFTIEAWCFFNSIAADNTVVACIEAGPPELGWNFRWKQTATQGFRLYSSSVGTFDFAYVPLVGQWFHVAISRSGTSLRCFVNGTQIGTTQTASGTVARSTSNPLTVGGGPYAATSTNGYLSNVRIVNGTAVYTANFTPPTTPLTAITNTSLLTCQANRFLDASSNNFTITRNGDVSVQPFSPFNPTTPYSTSAVGGSGYFDGSGDWLNTSSTQVIPSGSFTVEAWVYLTTTVTGAGVVAQGTIGNAARFSLAIEAGLWWAQIGGATINAGTPVTNTWTHLAVTFNGSTLTLYVNGTSVGTVSTSTNAQNTTLRIGSLGPVDWSTYYWPGYIGQVRISNTVRSISVPTALYTADANTVFLSNFTNGAIFDNAAVADYETVGNAQISTSVKKYGTGSIAFDGTGDYLVTDAPTVQDFTFGTGDFTIECWIYRLASGVQHDIVAFNPTSTNGLYPALYISTANALMYYTNSADRITGGTIAINTWYHIALCRVAGQTKLFINGTQTGSTYADTNSYLCGASRPLIGSAGFTPTGTFNGYIDDFRISKGIGRYPYNFTPPTAEFPNIGGTVTLTADPYFDYTTLLLPGNGTNGAQNNTFLDSSSNAFSITRNGNTTQGTFSPFSQTGWSNYFDGSGDYLETPSNAAFTLGSSGDFTVECWVYATATPGNYAAFMTTWADANTGYPNRWFIGVHDSKIKWYNDAGTSAIAASSNIQLNTWLHVAAVRSGSTITLYINGTAIGTQTTSQSYTTQGTVKLGYSGTGGNYFYGYISNARVVKGTAVYTANFTPPTAPLTAITNTSLLTCQSNRFIDNSTNAFAITRNGDVSVQAFSPFNPTAAWSAATNGGSGYFDGSGDYLGSPSSASFAFGTGNFTVEGWVYLLAAGDKGIFQQGTTLFPLSSSNSVALGINNTGTTWQIYAKNTNTNSTATYALNAWTHFALVRSGTTTTLYINGTSVITVTGDSTDYTGTYIGVGSIYGTSGTTINAYIADFRVVKGTAVYTAAFTPPTAPLTAITNTSLLLNFTNAGIYDATSKNDLETVGNAQISTTQSKFGGSSMYFDGTGDYLYRANNPNVLGSGDWTIEGWYYQAGGSGYRVFVSTRTAADGGVAATVFFGLFNNVLFYDGSTSGGISIVGGTSISASTWNHVALVRYGSTVTMYLNGVSQGTATDSNNKSNADLWVGGQNTLYYLNGYIDDLRITKGIARYTSNFTPPTTAFLTL